MLEIAVHITQALLVLGAAGAVYRVYKGPSVLDRVISLDVMLIIVASIMIVDMVINDHQDFILFVVVTAVIGFLGAVAIARYVVVRSPEEVVAESPEDAVPFPPAVRVASSSPAEGEPEAPHQPVATPVMPGIAPPEDESTSWFSALTRSGFTPKPRDDDAAAESRQPAPQPEPEPQAQPEPAPQPAPEPADPEEADTPDPERPQPGPAGPDQSTSEQQEGRDA
ncbi:monovalent cation/H+ antiporter complex subunit F [Nesterenkonia lutea]|uniref:Multicomponent Na+:H+ antiporter subunit F n=1 Tax=Nesterenkonia lutea TaxID=272919 RepID=A0ABR9JGF9_9MICC|nr:cation:proton antiporter [Nesterenkonia lutea]MBE1524863.1 multicomponent Na+:H+ antiporter subunit F [Nesterenkonia lutea]